MTLGHFKALLRDAMGLDAASIGDTAIEHAIRSRQRASHQPTLSAYWTLVSTSPSERQLLVEAVAVPETWFFRDRDAFGELVRCSAARLQSHPAAPLRVLSLPCSTGEEPYSMTMALLDAGVPGSSFRVDGVDISARVIAHARTGVYRTSSFRGTDLGFRDRYFRPIAAGHSIADAVRRQVTFQQGNLFSPTFLPGLHVYDVIFCRNVLIYFDQETQSRAIAVLTRLLASTGVLFVAPSETSILGGAFISTQSPRAFAFRRAESAPKETRRKRPSIPLPTQVSRSLSGPSPARIRPAPPREPSPLGVEAPGARAAVAPVAASSLDEAFALADRGRFDEAAECCRIHLDVNGPSAPAYYLLGLVFDVRGDAGQAAACYRKALYLDPEHEDALAQLALLMDAQGQTAEATTLRARIGRLTQKRA